MSLFLVAGSMFAQTFPVTSTADAPKFYTVASYNRGGVLTDADGNLQHVATNDNSYWYFTKADDNGGVHFCNLNGKYLQSNLTVGSTADVWYVLANGVNELGVSISKTNPISSSSCIDAHNYDAGVGTWAPNASDWEGTTWVFTAIDPIKDIEALLEANKENHSNNPAVGQYSTAGYKALAEAKETVKDPVAAVAAIKAFEKAKQLPLFTIDGGAKDYVVGTYTFLEDYSVGTVISDHSQGVGTAFCIVYDRIACDVLVNLVLLLVVCGFKLGLDAGCGDYAQCQGHYDVYSILHFLWS